MLPLPFSNLGKDVAGAVQEGARAAIGFAGTRDFGLEFVLAALYARRSEELLRYIDDKQKLEAMFLELTASVGKSTAETLLPAPPGLDSAPGSSIGFNSELIGILSNAATIAHEQGRLVSISDFLTALAQDSSAVSKLRTRWGLSLRHSSP